MSHMRTREDGGGRTKTRSPSEDGDLRRGRAAGPAFGALGPLGSLLLSAGLMVSLTACSGSSAMGPLGSGGVGMGGAGAGGDRSATAGAPGGGGIAAPGTGGGINPNGGGGGTLGPGAGGRQGGSAGTVGATGTGGGAAGTGVGGTAAGAGGRSSGSAGRSGAGSGGATAGAGGSMTMVGSGGLGGSAPEIPAGYVPGIVAVGYGGVRIVSRDGGLTWTDRVITPGSMGDDQGLLRAVAYGKGLWIATGWQILTSTDGINWTDRGLVDDGGLKGCHIVEGLTYANGSFYAACGIGTGLVYRSADGMNWTMIGMIGDTKQHVFITYRGGKFVAWGDTKTTFQSTDAVTWTVMDGVSEGTYCLGAFRNRSDCHEAAWFEDGFWLNMKSPGLILRSTDGNKFDTVFTDDRNYTIYDSRVFTPGYVAPH